MQIADTVSLWQQFEQMTPDEALAPNKRLSLVGSMLRDERSRSRGTLGGVAPRRRVAHEARPKVSARNPATGKRRPSAFAGALACISVASRVLELAFLGAGSIK
jgi:hypothetical protein